MSIVEEEKLNQVEEGLKMAVGNINCGICGFSIHAEVQCADGQHAQIKISSGCPSYQKIAEELQEVDVFQELFRGLHQGKCYEIFSKYSKHPSCPGLSGILKTIEVAAGMALPQEASIKVER